LGLASTVILGSETYQNQDNTLQSSHIATITGATTKKKAKETLASRPN
jgi:hypothetical protein